MIKDILIINLAGLNFKIEFYQTEQKFYYKILKNQILKHFKNCIINNVKKIDFYISIKEIKPRELFTLSDSSKKYYIDIFLIKNKRYFLTHYYISFYQFTSLLYFLILAKIRNSGFVLHCSAINTPKGAFLFLGSEGFGKSTIIKMLNVQPFHPIIDDIGVVKINNKKKFLLYQSSLFEKNYLEKNPEPFNIKAVFILKKSAEISFKKIHKKNEILEHLFSSLILIDKFSKSYFKNLKYLAKKIENVYLLKFSKKKNKLQKFFKSLLKTI